MSWSGLSYFAYNADNIEQLNIILPISMIGMFLYFGINNIFVMSLKPGKKPRPWYPILILCPALFFSVINFFIPVGFKDFIKIPGGWEFIPNIGAPINIIWLIYAYMTFFLSGLFLLIWNRKEKSTRKRKYNIILLIAAILTVTLLLFEYLLHSIITKVLPASISPILMSVWITGMYIAAKRHGFLEIFPEATAQEILHSLNEQIILVDKNGEILYMNDTANNYFKNSIHKSNSGNIIHYFDFEENEDITGILKQIDKHEKSIKATTLAGKSDVRQVFDINIGIVKDKYNEPSAYLFKAKISKNFILLREEYSLTERESEVIYLLANNFKNKTIGRHLGITERTVKAHLTNIYAKFNITGKIELLNILTKY